MAHLRRVSRSGIATALAPALATALALAGCGGVRGDGASPSPADSPAATASPTQTETPATSTPAATETLPPATSWEAVVFDRPESPAAINGLLVIDGRRLVAVGTAGGAGAVWTREPPADWQPVTEVPASAEDEVTVLVDVALGPGGLIAIGWVGRPASEFAQTVFWTSPDGSAWTETERAEGALLQDLEPGGLGMIAVGELPSVFAPAGVELWTSSDGATWERSGASDAFGAAGMRSVAKTEAGFAAVGAVRPNPNDATSEIHGAAWTSADGVTWTAVEHSPVFAEASIYSVTEAPSPGGGVLAVGSGFFAGGSAPAVWRSLDGTTWERLPLELAAGGFTDVAVDDVDDGSYVAVGFAEDEALALWTSTDGTSWTRVEEVRAQGTGRLTAVTLMPGSVVAAGSVQGATPDESHPVVVTGPIP